MKSLKKRVAVAVFAPLMAIGAGAIVPASVDAFSASNSVTISGTTHNVSAYSCNLYWSSCSYNAKASTSRTKSFTHYGYVKANGFNVTVNVSKNAGVSISGNSTTLATLSKSVYGTSHTIYGVVKPSVFSVSVAAKSRLKASGVDFSTGWTTW